MGKPEKQGIELSLEFIRFSLSYCEFSGVFRWKNPTSNRVKRGDVAGCVSTTTGYVFIRLGGKLRAAHRLAWFYINNQEAQVMIDHINGVKTDNRISNLRLASNAENKMNAGGHIGSTSRFCGVYYDKRLSKWRAQIMSNGKKKHLGVFTDEVSAAKAYDVAAIDMHGRFARLNIQEGVS